MSLWLQNADAQLATSLTDQQFPMFHLFDSGSQVSGKAVFSAIYEQKAQCSGKTDFSQWNGGRSGHKRTGRQEILQPQISLREGGSAVPFHISQSIFKMQNITV